MPRNYIIDNNRLRHLDCNCHWCVIIWPWSISLYFLCFWDQIQNHKFWGACNLIAPYSRDLFFFLFIDIIIKNVPIILSFFFWVRDESDAFEIISSRKQRDFKWFTKGQRDGLAKISFLCFEHLNVHFKDLESSLLLLVRPILSDLQRFSDEIFIGLWNVLRDILPQIARNRIDYGLLNNLRDEVLNVCQAFYRSGWTNFTENGTFQDLETSFTQILIQHFELNNFGW